MYKDLAAEIDRKSIDLGKRALDIRGFPPLLGIIQIGENPASSKYIKHKKIKIEKFGWSCKHIVLSENSSELEVGMEIQKMQQCDGIILQLPVPSHIRSKVIDYIDPSKDIDGITSINQGKLLKKYPSEEYITPCTAKACMHILDSYSVNLLGQRVAIFGRSFLVGKPLQILLEHRGATVVSLSKSDEEQADLSSKCKILISAIGSPHYIKQEYVHQDAFVIDIGTTLVNGKILGDVSPEVNARHITPSTGGIGPLTVSFLMLNLAKCSNDNL